MRVYDFWHMPRPRSFNDFEVQLEQMEEPLPSRALPGASPEAKQRDRNASGSRKVQKRSPQVALSRIHKPAAPLPGKANEIPWTVGPS